MEDLSIDFGDQTSSDTPSLNINFESPAASAKPAGSVYEAFVSGLEGSASGLMYNKKLPDIVLDEHHSTWLQRRAQEAGGIVGDLPEMVAGGIAGGLTGGVIGAGAASMALPAAIRTAYTEAYKKGDIQNVGDFLGRSAIVMQETGKAAIVGAVGGVAGRGAMALSAGYGLGATGTVASTLAAETGAFTVTPALLEGRLPALDDFGNAAIMIAGFKGAHVAASAGISAISGRIANTYAKTGATPIDIVRDAKLDPQISEDLGVPKIITPQIENWRETSAKPLPPEGVTNSIDLANKLKEHLGEDHFASPILDKLIPNLKGFNVEVLPESAWLAKGYSKNRVAQFNEKTNSLQFKDGIQIEAAFHELIHEGTARRLLVNQSFNQDITAIMGRVQDAITNGNVEMKDMPPADLRRMKAAMKNPAEFVAYGLSSPKVINVLRGIRGAGNSPTMFTTFIQTVAKAFGFQQKEYSALHDLIGAVEKGVDTPLETKTEQTTPPAAEATTKTPEVNAPPAKVEASVETAPPVGEKIETPPPAPEREIPRAYEKMASEDAASEAFPGNKAQQVIDTPFAELPGMKLPYQMNLKYVNTTDDIASLLTRMSDVYKEEINDQRNNTVSWAEQDKKLREEGENIFGKDFENIVGGRKGGDAVSSLEIKARIDLWKQATLEAHKALDVLKKAGLNATEDMKLIAQEAIQKHALIHAELIGAAAEAARALQLMKIIKEIRVQGEGLQKLAEAMGNNPDDLLNLAMQAETPEQLGKIIQEANKATNYQKFMELQRAFLTSGIRTHEANIIGNLIFGGPLRLAVDAISVPIGFALRNAERTRLEEPMYKLMGMVKGIADGSRLAWHILKTGEPVGGKVENNRNAIGGMFGEAVRLNFRVLGAEDAFFKGSLERGELSAMAARQARKEGIDPRTPEFAKRISELTEKPPEEMLKEAQDYAKRMTFNSPLGARGRALQNAVRAWHLDPIIPFTGTPLNIFEQFVRHSPGAPIIDSWRADFAKGGQARDKALGEMMVGTGVMVTGYMLAANGHLTGNGDPDPKKRATQMSSGWKPYSIKVGNEYYPINRFAPVSTLMTMMADVYEAQAYMEDGEKEKAMKMAFVAFSNAINNQTFVSGLAKFLTAWTDPYNRFESFAEGFAGSLVPGAISQFNNDPYRRETYSILDAVYARLPGLSEKLQPARDLFGDKIEASGRFNVIDPSTQSEDKVRLEAARLGIGVSKAPKSIQVKAHGHRDLGKLELTPEQRDIFAETKGKAAHSIMERYVNSPTWDFLSKDRKIDMFNHAFEIAGKRANRAAVTHEQRHQKQEEVHNELRRRMVPENSINLP